METQSTKESNMCKRTHIHTRAHTQWLHIHLKSRRNNKKKMNEVFAHRTGHAHTHTNCHRIHYYSFSVFVLWVRSMIFEYDDCDFGYGGIYFASLRWLSSLIVFFSSSLLHFIISCYSSLSNDFNDSSELKSHFFDWNASFQYNVPNVTKCTADKLQSFIIAIFEWKYVYSSKLPLFIRSQFSSTIIMCVCMYQLWFRVRMYL